MRYPVWFKGKRGGPKGPLGNLIFPDAAKNDGGAGAAIQAAGDTVYNRTKQTPDEASQYTSSFDLGKELEQYFTGQMTGQPTGALTADQQFQNQGDLNKTLYDQVLSQAQNPTAGWQSTLQPELQQAQDQINKYYNARGLINSGIPIGDMGTAGVDLAIKNAQNEMAYQQQSLSNAQSLSANINQNANQNVGNLYNLYGAQQGFGLNSLSRQATGANAAAQYQAYPYQAQLGSYYGGVAAQQALPGQLIGAAGTMAGAAMMCWVAAEVFGGWEDTRTHNARKFIANIGPKWFFRFYLKNGERIALFIKNKPLLKNMLKPVFELFAMIGGA
jgi:hypothetical protein